MNTKENRRTWSMSELDPYSLSSVSQQFNIAGSLVPVVFHLSNNIITAVEINSSDPAHQSFCQGCIGSPFYKTIKSYLIGHGSEGSITKLADQVPLSAVQPGDVLFYDYTPGFSTHVAIYIGQGMAVHGGRNGLNVVIDTIYLSGRAAPTAWHVPR